MNLGNRHSQRSFAQIPSVNMSRSKFDRSFSIKTTFDFDYLTPIFVDEILPGDTINLNVKSFARLATQAVPIMDNMYLDYFFFFVPNRLVWQNWERFNGAQDEPTSSTDYLVPQIELSGPETFEVGSIGDQFGLPTGITALSVNALPFRAYQLIWNDWFRDQNLQDKLSVPTTDGPDSVTLYQLLKRAKKHDYFTSALPWPQKGDAIQFPLGTTAPVISTGAEIRLSDNVTANRAMQITTGLDIIGSGAAPAATKNLFFGSTTGLETDLSTAASATINQLRQAMMMQSLIELDARGGTRYVEILRAHFNVISPDFRLQRPEFLSAGTTLINQHPVAQTSETGTTPLGTLGAFSTSANIGNNIGFSKSFVEHGWVIGLVQARGEVTYQQGLNRMWSRSTRWDYFWPKLQELGEQAILNKEIYAQGTSADEDVYGYQERYSEYRYRPSEIRGQFRSTFATSLDVWHLAQEYTSLPDLENNLPSSTPIERALVVASTYPHLLYDAYFDYKHARPMTTYGVPATLGRF